jgi:hypothetical protein
MNPSHSPKQLTWGILLVAAGVGVFFRIPQVMPRLEQIQHFAAAPTLVRLCFYLMGILLIGGGSKKIIHYFRRDNDSGNQTG